MARFYFNRTIYWWGTFVEKKMEEAEAAVRKQMKNRKGTDVFVNSHRIAAFNKLFGLSTAAAYRQPDLPGQQKEQPKVEVPKGFGIKNVSGFAG